MKLQKTVIAVALLAALSTCSNDDDTNQGDKVLTLPLPTSMILTQTLIR